MDPDGQNEQHRYWTGGDEEGIDAADTTGVPKFQPTSPQPNRPGFLNHPGFMESLVPIWGPAREAAADGADRDWTGVALNTLLTGADLFGAGELSKGGLKLTGSHTWPATRKWLTKTGFAKKGQVVHHSPFERNQGIGKFLPDIIKNQPPNLKPMPSAQIHDRMNHAAWGQPRLNVLERYHYGTPDWLKWAKPVAVGHGLLGNWRTHQNPNKPKDHK